MNRKNQGQQRTPVPASKFGSTTLEIGGTKRHAKNRNAWDDSLSNLSSMKATKSDLARRKVLSKSNNLDAAKRELARPRTMDQLNSSTTDVLDKAKSIIDALNSHAQNQNRTSDIMNGGSTLNIDLDRPLTSTAGEDFQMSLQLVGAKSNEVITYPAKVAEITYAPELISTTAQQQTMLSQTDTEEQAEQRHIENSTATQLLQALGPATNIEALTRHPSRAPSLPATTEQFDTAKDSAIGKTSDVDFVMRALGELCSKVQFLCDHLGREQNQRETLEKKVEWMAKRIEMLEKKNEAPVISSLVGQAQNTSTPIKNESAPVVPHLMSMQEEVDDKLKNDMLQCLQMLRKTKYQGEDVQAGSDEAKRLADLNRAMHNLEGQQLLEEASIKQLDQVEMNLH